MPPAYYVIYNKRTKALQREGLEPFGALEDESSRADLQAIVDDETAEPHEREMARDRIDRIGIPLDNPQQYALKTFDVAPDRSVDEDLEVQRTIWDPETLVFIPNPALDRVPVVDGEAQ
jgi:hypothetical protein